MKYQTILLLFYCVIVSKALVQDESNEIDDTVSLRLPNNTLPIRYDLWIKTDVDREIFTFTGRVKIQVKVLEDSNNVTLNSEQSKVDRIDLLDSQMRLVGENLRFEVIKELEFLAISLPQIYRKDDEFTLAIQYNGELRDNDVNLGFYRSSYEDKNQKRKFYATTQFQMTEARHMMPCYDEPQIRAVFSIEIQHDKSYNAISNMPIESREVIAGTDYVASKFVDTPPMQTYLVAFVISDLAFISNNDSKVEQRIYANPQSIASEGNFVLSVVGPMLKKFEEYFGIEYPLPKIDHAAIADFPYWAMENFGLLTYRQDFLLHSGNDQGLSNSARQRTVQILAHEFAHQYFGNLVAPKWWTYAWLNEGFATLYQYMIPEIMFPGNGFMHKFNDEVRYRAMRKDWYFNQKMSQYAEDSESIRKNFNDIGNQKAAAVLRMFQEAFTVETFTKGLKYYLNAMKFSAATPDDLHRELQKALDEDQPGNGVDVGEVMRTWEDQPGYPLITVNRSGNHFVLTQKTQNMKGDEVYAIPLAYTTKNNPHLNTSKVWMKSRVLEIEAQGDDDWIHLDPHDVGYFNVKYLETMTGPFMKQLQINDQVFSLKQKLVCLESLIKMFDDLTVVEVLNSLKFLRGVEEPLVWERGIGIIGLISDHLVGTEMYPKFTSFVQWLIEPNLKRLGFVAKQNESESDSELRFDLVDLSCEFNSMDCLLQELKNLEAHLENSDNEVRLCDGLKLANMSVHEGYLSSFRRKEIDFFEALDFIGCSFDQQIIQAHLNLTLDKSCELLDYERNNFVLVIMKRSPEALRAGLRFIEANFKEL
jgi:aminopeptidase N